MTRPAPIIAGTVAALLLLFGAYMGGYYAMLEGCVRYASDSAGGIDVNYTIGPDYRIDYEGAHRVLWLAHRLDRLIRPGYWNAPTPTAQWRSIRHYIGKPQGFGVEHPAIPPSAVVPRHWPPVGDVSRPVPALGHG